MGAGAGKVALVNANAERSAAAAAASTTNDVVDFVGYGSAADGVRAGHGPTPAPQRTSTSAQRTTDPFANTGNN